MDMSAKTHIMHIMYIDAEEIPRISPNFSDAQSLSEDEIVDIPQE